MDRKFGFLLGLGFILLINGCKSDSGDAKTQGMTTLQNRESTIQTSDETYTVTLKLAEDKVIKSVEINGTSILYTLDDQKKILVQPADSIVQIRNTMVVETEDGSKTASSFIGKAKKIDYKIVNTSPHDTRNFTQGLLFYEGVMYESTGLEGRSKIIRYKTIGGKFIVDKEVRNPANEFGEGIAVKDGEIIQLLWQNGFLNVYDQETLTLKKKMNYASEGWGIVNHNGQLFTSDGSGTISTLDLSGQVARKLTGFTALDHKGGVKNLNELEMVNGKMLANVWQSDLIYVIEPRDGVIEGVIDLSVLTVGEAAGGKKIDVLNGIAYNEVTKELWVTGKLWSNFYHIQLEGF